MFSHHCPSCLLHCSPLSVSRHGPHEDCCALCYLCCSGGHGGPGWPGRVVGAQVALPVLDAIIDDRKTDCAEACMFCSAGKLKWLMYSGLEACTRG